MGMLYPNSLRKYLLILIFSVATLLIVSCKTYYIPMESFKRQLGLTDSTFKADRAKGSIGSQHLYKTDTLKFIQCYDKNNQPFQLRNSQSVEIRFTHGNQKTVFYFDSIFLTDSAVIGVQSRLMPSMQKTIALSDITKIEVQDSGKR